MKSSEKIDSLTSLRFFAAAMIVLGHSHRLFGSMGLANTLSLAQGVSFFFVLSGFILAYNYPDLTEEKAVTRFFKARFARIWPAHIAAVCLMVLLTADLNVGGLNFAQACFASVANVFLLQSIVPLKDVFLGLNGVSWSISTEAFFYLAFPLLIAKSKMSGKSTLAILALVVLMYLWFGAVWEVPSDETVSTLNLMGLLYVNPIVRVFEFFMGVIACRTFLRWRHAGNFGDTRRSIFSLLESGVVVLALTTMWLSPRLTSLLGWQGAAATTVNYYLVKSGSAIVFAGLIATFAFGRGALSQALSWPVAVLLGEISFSLYLVHTSVLKWYENNITLFSLWPEIAKAGGYWSLSLLIAWQLHKTIENPCRKLILAPSGLGRLEAVKSMFARQQVAYVVVTLCTLFAMYMAPRLLAAPSCLHTECEAIEMQNALPAPAAFDKYVSLIALRANRGATGDRVLDLLFEVEQPLPEGYKLAIHIAADDGSIVNQSDFNLVRSSHLSKGSRWVERVQIPDRFIESRATKLGIVIYADPRSPLHVSYPQTDYDGRRMLISLSAIGMK